MKRRNLILMLTMAVTLMLNATKVKAQLCLAEQGMDIVRCCIDCDGCAPPKIC